jgi:hypothetical protein
MAAEHATTVAGRAGTHGPGPTVDHGTRMGRRRRPMGRPMNADYEPDRPTREERRREVIEQAGGVIEFVMRDS